MDSVTLGSNATGVTFSNIDQSFGDLVLIIRGAGTGNVYPVVRFNNVSSAIHKIVELYGTGASLGGYTATNTSAVSVSANTWVKAADANLVKAHIMDYSATDKHKGVLSTAGQTGSSAGFGTELIFAKYPDTNAITTMFVWGFNGVYLAGSTFHLYGILK
jgi:hypothetical protein